jgi:uncharacterized protein YciI
MHYFFYKLIGPRPTFPADMTAAEAHLMAEHSAYWKALTGSFVTFIGMAFGPVADPKGPYGVAIVQLPDGTLADAQALAADDPVVKGGIGFRVEVHPMMSLVVPEMLG